jgi:hypothetical protein
MITLKNLDKYDAKDFTWFQALLNKFILFLLQAEIVMSLN